jgi:hypothetical protein
MNAPRCRECLKYPCYRNLTGDEPACLGFVGCGRFPRWARNVLAAIGLLFAAAIIVWKALQR